MEAHDVFADYMKVRGPTTERLTTRGPWVTRGGDIAYKGVEPDVDSLPRVTRDRDPPSQSGSRAGYR